MLNKKILIEILKTSIHIDKKIRILKFYFQDKPDFNIKLDNVDLLNWNELIEIINSVDQFDGHRGCGVITDECKFNNEFLLENLPRLLHLLFYSEKKASFISKLIGGLFLLDYNNKELNNILVIFVKNLRFTHVYPILEEFLNSFKITVSNESMKEIMTNLPRENEYTKNIYNLLLPLLDDPDFVETLSDLGLVPGGKKRKEIEKIFIFKSDVKIEEKEKENKRECGICQEKDVNSVFIPCGHTYCEDCAKKTKGNNICAFCRKEIESVYKIYF